MDINVKKANEVKIKTVMKKMEARGFTPYYCEDSAAAVKQALELVGSKEALVSWGGTATVAEVGIKAALAEGGYNVMDPYAAPDKAASFEAKRQALLSDVFFLSANAVTMDGEMVNIDGNGNRVAGLIFGPKKVIVVVGANKLVANVDDAIDRIKVDACPANCIRLGLMNPCAVTGKCANCLSATCICDHTVITRNSIIKDRIHVIFVNEVLGF